MRLRCRLGVHLIDWGTGGTGNRGDCAYCGQEFLRHYGGLASWNENVTREQDRAARRQAKIDKAKEARHDH